MESESSWWAPILSEKKEAQCAPEKGEIISESKVPGESEPKNKKRTAAAAGLDLVPCSPIKKVRDDAFTPEAPGEESKNL